MRRASATRGDLVIFVLYDLTRGHLVEVNGNAWTSRDIELARKNAESWGAVVVPADVYRAIRAGIGSAWTIARKPGGVDALVSRTGNVP